MSHSPASSWRRSLLTIIVPAVPAPNTSSFFTDCSSAFCGRVAYVAHHLRKHSHLGIVSTLFSPEGYVTRGSGPASCHGSAHVLPGADPAGEVVDVGEAGGGHLFHRGG